MKLEMTRLCAEAMGYHTEIASDGDTLLTWSNWMHGWNPLHDDAQAMALVKKMELELCCPSINAQHDWIVRAYGEQTIYSARNKDLNRAIVECVAKLRGLRGYLGTDAIGNVDDADRPFKRHKDCKERCQGYVRDFVCGQFCERLASQDDRTPRQARDGTDI